MVEFIVHTSSKSKSGKKRSDKEKTSAGIYLHKQRKSDKSPESSSHPHTMEYRPGKKLKKVAKKTGERKPKPTQPEKTRISTHKKKPAPQKDRFSEVVYITTGAKKSKDLTTIIEEFSSKHIIIVCNRKDTASMLAKELEAGQDTHSTSNSHAKKKTSTGKLFITTDYALRKPLKEKYDVLINFNLPQRPNKYRDRIKAAVKSRSPVTVISFACETDAMYIPEIENAIGHALPCKKHIRKSSQ